MWLLFRLTAVYCHFTFESHRQSPFELLGNKAHHNNARLKLSRCVESETIIFILSFATIYMHIYLMFAWIGIFSFKTNTGIV